MFVFFHPMFRNNEIIGYDRNAVCHCTGNIDFHKETSMQDKYKYMAPLYDFLATIYSNGSIDSCKKAMVDKIRKGDQVLFAGVGHGVDAIAAARAGGAVTVVDMSEKMLSQFNANLKKNNLDTTVIQINDNILNVKETGKYDFVFGNFFLNVFYEDNMRVILKQLESLVKPGGYLVIGDWAHPEGNIFKRTFQNIYWVLGVTPFYLITKNAFHPIYNYPQEMANLGLKVVEKKYFTYMGVNCFWSLLGQKEQ